MPDKSDDFVKMLGISPSALKRVKSLMAEVAERRHLGDVSSSKWSSDANLAAIIDCELRLDSISRLLPGRLMEFDLQKQIYSYMNQKHYWTGHSLDEWNDLSLDQQMKWIHPEDLEPFQIATHDWEMSDQSEPFEVQYRVRTRKGLFIWLDVYMNYILAPDGENLSRLEYSEDISIVRETEQRLSNLREELETRTGQYRDRLSRMTRTVESDTQQYVRGTQELRLNLENFRNLIRNSLDGILVSNLENEIVFANRRISEICGYENDTLLKSSLDLLFPPEELEFLIERVEKRVEGQFGNRQFEASLIDSLGHQLKMELTAVRTSWQGEDANVFTVRDVKERRLSAGKRISLHVRNAVEDRYMFQGMVSKSPQMLRNFEILPTIANSESSLIVTGESGTGKELMVRAIHNLSPRKDKPLVMVNSAALPDTLIESELFGYKKGAFTDAKQDKPGRFVQADGGTIFLDEIGDISTAMQVKLLRVLQEKAVEPLGGKDSIKIDTRVIAATNRNLEKMVNENKFRQDLFYRLNVIQINMPPLRDRTEDLPVLVEHFIGKFNTLFGKDITSVSPQALSMLMNYQYPGNIRELENFIEHAFLLCRGDKIMPEHLPDSIKTNYSDSNVQISSTIRDQTETNREMTNIDTGSFSNDASQNYPSRQAEEPAFGKHPFEGVTLEEFETKMIIDALQKHMWNRTASARELGIHRVTLNRKIKKLKIALPDIDGRHSYSNT